MQRVHFSRSRLIEFYLLLILTIIPLVGCSIASDPSDSLETTSSEPDQSSVLAALLAEGEQLLDQTEYDAAYAKFEEAIALNAESAAAYTGRGQSQRMLGNSEASLTDLNHAISLDPTYAPAWQQRGILYRNVDNFTDALTDFDHAIELDPTYTNTFVSRGYLHELQGNLIAALTDYNEAIQHGPEDAHAYWYRGDLLFTGFNDDTSALADLDIAITLAPQLGGPYSSRAQIHRLAGEYANARADLDKAISLGANGSFAYNERGLLNWLENDLQGALSDFSTALQRNNQNSWSLLRRGNIYSDLGQHDNALEDYNKVLTLNPDNAEALTYRAQIYQYQHKNFDSAFDDYLQATKLAPEMLLANREMANLLNFTFDEPEYSIRYYDTSIRAAPEEPYTYFNRGIAHHKLSNKADALADYQQFIQLIGGRDLETVARAEQNIADLNTTITDNIVGLLTEALVSEMVNSFSSSESSYNSNYPVVVRQGYRDSRGQFHESYCSGCTYTTETR